MPRYLTILILLLTILCISYTTADARPKKGFHTGPYLALQIGVMQADFDRNEAMDIDIGRKYEPTFGFVFGWNLWDFFSAELQGRYATSKNVEQREHLASANVYAKWTLVTDALTDFKSLHILPFLKGGLAVRIGALPGAPGSSNGIVKSFGAGPSFGGGVMFLCKKYVYFGFDVQEDIIITNQINQTVNGVPNVLVYKGGLHPSFSAMGTIGVHY